MRQLFIFVFLGFAACSCEPTPGCDSTTCPTGCCKGDVCHPGTRPEACGAPGATCDVCAPSDLCAQNACMAPPPDAGLPPPDSGEPEPDAGGHDSGVPDSGAPDSGVTVPDAGPHDAGSLPVDSGVPRRDGGATISFDLPTSFRLSANGFTSYRAFISPIDFNRDGLSDLISSASGDLSLILSSADAGLLPPISLSNRSNVTPCALAADFTGDGVGDLFVDDQYTQQLRRGHGDGTFDAPLALTPYVLGACSGPLRATDAGPELTVVGGGTLQRLRIAGSNFVDAGFQNVTLPGNLGPRLAADLTGDGRDDLVVFSGSDATVYAGTATGLAPPISTNLSCVITRAVSGRFDTDAFADLAVLTTCGVRVWYGSATGALVRPSAAIAVERLPIAVTAADVSGDGLSDLMVEVHNRDTNNPAQHFVSIFLNQGNGAFTYRERLVSPDTTHDLEVGRFDFDGVPDLYAFGVFGVWLGVGQPSTVFRLGLMSNPQGGSSAGFLHADGDGRLDAVTPVGRDGGLQLFSGDGQGRFTPTVMLPTRPGVIAQVSTGRFGGTAAIALGGYVDDQADVLEVVDSGVVRTTTIPYSVGYPQATPPTFVDLDRDGVDELLFHDFSRVVLARRTGPGVFAYQLLPTPNGVGGVDTADFDRDGRTDIFSWHYSDKRLAVHRALPDGGFADGGSVLHNNFPLLGIAGDLTGDGIADVGVTSSFDNGIATWAGSATGFAASPTFVTMDQNPNTLTLVDLDGDGRDELVVGYSFGANVYRMPGATQITTLPYPHGTPRFVDVNGDGLPDLIVALFEGGFGVHLNTSR